MPNVSQSGASGSRFEIGERVRLKGPVAELRTEAVVSAMSRRGNVWLNFTGPPPHPFFKGPYEPHELERV